MYILWIIGKFVFFVFIVVSFYVALMPGVRRYKKKQKRGAFELQPDDV